MQGGKMLLRIDDRDPSTADTLESSAHAVTDLAHRSLMAMVEPLPYYRGDDGSLLLRNDGPALARAVTIASALGNSSAHTWLKMPASDDLEMVFGATTLPCVMLGGVPSPDPSHDLGLWARALKQPTVRGLVVGRALLYPPHGDVSAAVDAAATVLSAANSGREA